MAPQTGQEGEPHGLDRVIVGPCLDGRPEVAMEGDAMRGGKLLPALLILAAAVSLPARAQEPVAVSCDGFVIGYDGPAKQKGCVVVDVEQGPQTYKSSQLTVIDHTFFILMYYIESGFRSYLPEHGLREMTNSSNVFAQTGDWQAQRTIQGFEAAVFTGVLKGRQIPSICAVISRYSGTPGRDVDQSLGPGYKDHLTAYYCAVAESLTPEQQGAGFYELVRDVIGRLRVPPAEP
jgi:hypothetical protein